MLGDDYIQNAIRTESVKERVTVPLDLLIGFADQVGRMKSEAFYKGKCCYGHSVTTIDGADTRLVHAAMGLISESGEILESVGSGDQVNLKEEVGDILWYVAILLDELRKRGIAIGDICTTNISKLKERYPEEFTEHASLVRDLAAERKILETGGR